MGNSSYKLHQACPDLDRRYRNCQSLYFENIHSGPLPAAAVAPGSDAASVSPPARAVYRDGRVVTNAADVALTLDAMNPASPNYACREMWTDYTDCINEVMAEKKADYLRRKAEKEAAKAGAQTQTQTHAATEEPKQ